MIEKSFLIREYIEQQKSVSDIAKQLKCSQSRVTYWLQKHRLKKRTISDAIYIKNNPDGDPFHFKKPTSTESWFLYGLGLGLFWGEGNKVNKYSVRLGNTDPALIKVFLEFLSVIFNIDTTKLRFGLQIFSDTSPAEAKGYWVNRLNVKEQQFQTVVVTKSNKPGTYTKKKPYGVLTIYFSNTKLRASILSAISALQTNSYANVAQSVERIHGKSQ